MAEERTRRFMPEHFRAIRFQVRPPGTSTGDVKVMTGDLLRHKLDPMKRNGIDHDETILHKIITLR